MAKRETRLPALTTLESIKEALDVRLGRRGDKLDKAVTFRDLEKSGSFRTGAGSDGDIELVPPKPGSGGEDVDPETWVPAAPTGFEARSMFGGIFLRWDWPPKFGAINFTEVYRATTNSAADRELLTVGDMLSYFDEIDGNDEQEYFYWIRFRSLGGKVSPFTGPVSGVSIPAVKDIIDRLEGELTETELTDALNTRLDRIEPIDALAQQLETGLYEEIQERQSADQQLINVVNVQVANLDNAIAAVQTELNTEVTRIDGRITATSNKIDTVQTTLEGALATSVSDLNTQITNVEGDITAVANQVNEVQVTLGDDISGVRQDMTAEINQVEGTVDSMYTLRVQSGDKIAGFGLSNDGTTSDFAVLADRFYIVNTFGNVKTTPFIVEGGNVYIRTAMIEQAFVDTLTADILDATEANIANAYIDWAQITNAQIVAADIKDAAITNAKIGNIIQSNNFSSGSSGWQIRKDGNAEFNSVDFRGTIDFADLRVSGKPVSEYYPIVQSGSFGGYNRWTTIWSDSTTLYRSTQTGHVSFSGTYSFWGRLRGSAFINGAGVGDNAYAASYQITSTFEYKLYMRVDSGSWTLVQAGMINGPTAGGALRETNTTSDSDSFDVSGDFATNVSGTMHVGDRSGNFVVYVRMDIRPVRNLTFTPLTDGNPYVTSSAPVEHVSGWLNPATLYFNRF